MSTLRQAVCAAALLAAAPAWAAAKRAAPAPAAPAAPVAAAAEAPAAHWLDTPAEPIAAPRSSAVGYAAAGAFATLLMGGAVFALYKRNPTALARGGAERIDLLAVRSIGGRQRLCLVETLGERMLIAVGDHDASLISHLPGGQIPTAAEADGALGADEATTAAALVDQAMAAPVRTSAPPAPAAAATQASWAPSAEQVFASARAAAPAPRQPAAPPPQPPVPASRAGVSTRPLGSGDVAGLRHWRSDSEQVAR